MGIRTKLILSTCLPLLVIYAIVLSWDYLKSKQQALQQIEQLVAQRASADAAQVNARLMTVQQIVNQAAYALGTRSSMMATNPSRPPMPNGSEGGPPGGDRGPPPEESQGTGPNPRNGGLLQRGGRQNFFGGGFNGFLGGSIRNSPWISSIWVKLDPTAPNAVRGDLFGVKRLAADRRPEEFHPDLTKVAAVTKIANEQGHGLWIDPADVGDAGTGKPFLFAEPFFAPDEAKPLGVVCVTVAADLLRFLQEDSPVQSELRRMLGVAPTTQSTTEMAAHEPRSLAHGGYLLIDRNGNIISRPDGKQQGTPLAVGPDQEELQEAIDRALKGSGQIVIAGGLDQVLGEMAPRSRYVLAMEPLKSTTGWLYVTAAPESELLDPVQDRLFKRAGFLTASLLVLVIVVMWVLTRFCRPIEQMARSVHQLAAGDLDIEPVPVMAKDELGQLAKGFNDMTGRLRHHVAELTAQTAEREKVESELRIARQIQADLLPRTFPPFPDRDEFALHAVNIPARYIAGDFFDFFFTTPDLLTIVIADVSGKGIPAALMMAVTRTIVRNLAGTGLSPREIAERINKMLVEDTTPGMFVTMLLGQYEPSTGKLTYVNAGHPAAVCVSKGRDATLCAEPTGPLLGVDATGLLGSYEQATMTLAAGDTVLFYTDGVTEAHSEDNVLFGQERLVAHATALAEVAPPEFCDGLVTTVMAYQHQAMTDDLTLVALKRR